MLHHDTKKLDDNFGARSDENLSLVTFLGIVDTFERITEYIHSHHGCKIKNSNLNLNYQHLNYQHANKQLNNSLI